MWGPLVILLFLGGLMMMAVMITFAGVNRLKMAAQQESPHARREGVVIGLVVVLLGVSAVTALIVWAIRTVVRLLGTD